MEYAFLDRTQVLYARLVSLHSLLPAAEEALRRGNLTKAEQIISRCMKLEPENPLLLFLQALIDLRRGRFNSTRTCLHRLRDAGFAGEAVSGLLAEVDRAEGAE
jgi:Flp pilus assembly protein TadD